MSENWQGLVVVSRYLHPLDARTQADLDKMRLEEAGVEAVVLDSKISTILPNETIAFGGVKVAVRFQDAQEALNLLEQDGEICGREPGQSHMRLARCVYYWAIRLIAAMLVLGAAVNIGRNELDTYGLLEAAVVPAVAVIALLLVRKGRQIEKQKEKTQ